MRNPRGLVLEAFPTLQREGFGFIDAGARGAMLPAFRDMAPFVKVVGFEPEEEGYEGLRAGPGAAYLPYALGERDAQSTLYILRKRWTSSCYKPNRSWLDRFPDADRFDVVATTPIQVRSLDSLVSDGGAPLLSCVDFLKLDTQGSELDILKGASQVLQRHVMGVEVEVEFARLYEGQPLFHDVHAFLTTCGFSLFKLRRYSWVRRTCQERPQVSAGQVVAGDALYLRDPLSHGDQPVGSLSAHQAEALVFLATLYDLNDFALEIVSDPALSAVLAVDAVKRWIAQRGRRLDLRGRAILTACLKGRRGWGTLYDWVRRRSWGRADSDREFYTRT